MVFSVERPKTAARQTTARIAERPVVLLGGEQDEARKAARRRAVRAAVGRYAVGSVLVLGLVGTGAVVVAGHVAADSAVASAGRFTARLAKNAIAPNVTAELRRDVGNHLQSSAALDRLARVVDDQRSENEIERIKVWTDKSEILFSDEPRLIGATGFQLEDDDLATLANQTTEAKISPTTKVENRYERQLGRTVEVYTGVKDADGNKILVEAYLPTDSVDQLEADLVLKITSLVVGSLLVLELLLLPLAIWLARRIHNQQAESERLRNLAGAAAAAERRSIAAHLHDTVIPDLAGIGFTLGMVQSTLRREGRDGTLMDPLTDVAAVVQSDVRALRSMLGPLTDSDSRTTLADVVRSSLDDVRALGIDVDADLEPVVLPADVRTALALVAREALRNVVRHSQATTVVVRLTCDDRTVSLQISDDGRGFDPAAAHGLADGHLGLTLYTQTAEAAGGRSELRTAPGAGTTVRVQVPLPTQERARGLGIRQRRG